MGVKAIGHHLSFVRSFAKRFDLLRNKKKYRCNFALFAFGINSLSNVAFWLWGSHLFFLCIRAAVCRESVSRLLHNGIAKHFLNCVSFVFLCVSKVCVSFVCLCVRCQVWLDHQLSFDNINSECFSDKVCRSKQDTFRRSRGRKVGGDLILVVRIFMRCVSVPSFVIFMHPSCSLPAE